jgi:hypothetical protein
MAGLPPVVELLLRVVAAAVAVDKFHYHQWHRWPALNLFQGLACGNFNLQYNF